VKENKDYEVSSGNVFADLGLPNPEERLAKAELARQIYVIIKERKLNQAAAAELLGIDQPKVSALINGKLTGFSLERLFKLLNILDQAITIRVSPRTKSKRTVDVIVTEPKLKKISVQRQPTNTNSLGLQAQKRNGKRKMKLQSRKKSS
jgi:predicted XRE-type DNA-binding protein